MCIRYIYLLFTLTFKHLLCRFSINVEKQVSSVYCLANIYITPTWCDAKTALIIYL